VIASHTDFGRRITVGTVNINDGTFHKFDQTNTSYADMARAAFSSASIPTVFPPYNWEGKGLFVDGSTATNINVEDAITQCKELVDDESKITIDILLCGGANQSTKDWQDVGQTIPDYLRGRSIRGQFHGGNTVADARKAHPDVNFRYVIGQEDGFTSTGMINFDGDHTWKLQEKGRLQAQDALTYGEGTHFGLLMAWMEDEGLQAEYPNYTDFVKSLKDDSTAAEKDLEQCIKDAPLSLDDWDMNKEALSECAEQAGYDVQDENSCALRCTLEAILVYWAEAIHCIEKQAPNSCITAKCPAIVAAFDVACLKSCH